MSELLESKLYRIWLKRPPQLYALGQSPPWRLYVQREADGRWGKKEFDDYDEALKTLFRFVDKYHDLALNCPRQGFKIPSIVKDGQRYTYKIPLGHHWCGYCRRPTSFRKFKKHHAFPQKWQGLITIDHKRCLICGIRQNALTHKVES